MQNKTTWLHSICTLFNQSGWNWIWCWSNSSRTSNYYFWVIFIETREISAVLLTVKIKKLCWHAFRCLWIDFWGRNDSQYCVGLTILHDAALQVRPSLGPFGWGDFPLELTWVLTPFPEQFQSVHACVPSHGLKRSWYSCPWWVNASNKNTPSAHHPGRPEVTTSLVGLKNGLILKNLIKNCESQRYSGECRESRRINLVQTCYDNRWWNSTFWCKCKWPWPWLRSWQCKKCKNFRGIYLKKFSINLMEFVILLRFVGVMDLNAFYLVHSIFKGQEPTKVIS